MIKLRFLTHICWLAAVLFTLATACGPEASPESEPGESDIPVSQAALNRTKWVLVAYGADENPLEPVEGSVVTAAFNNGNEMHGVAGCNNYFPEPTPAASPLTGTTWRLEVVN